MDFNHLDIVDDDGHHHVADPVTALLASKIRDAFIDAHSVWCGVRTKAAAKHNIHFYKAAVLCQEYDLTPEEFVEIQFAGIKATLEGKGLAHVPIRLIASPKFLSDRRSGVDGLKLYQVRYYGAQLLLFENQLKIGTPVELIVKDKTLPITPLFRCVMAWKFGFVDVVKEYLDDARFEAKAIGMASELFTPKEIEFLNVTL